MIVRRLALSGFRNYNEQSVEFSPHINVITGANAQGKTNLLEAVYLLSGAHSFRTRYDKELIQFDCSWAKILADVVSADREQTIQLLYRHGQNRTVTVNSSKKKPSELAELVRVVLFSPEDLYLIKEGPAVRRRLMDSAISQLRPAYGALIADYNRLLESKTKILKEWRERPDLLDTLDVYSDRMAKISARVIRYRESYVRRLCAAANEIHRDFSGNAESLHLKYQTVSSVEDAAASAEDIYYRICDHQEKHRAAELDSGLCLTGIHKDDICIDINRNSARSYASQGQTRTAALSIKLAEREIMLEETGEYPILLLDDVLSELDAKRQSFVLNRIAGGQTLITCCEDESITERTGGHVITIKNGTIC